MSINFVERPVVARLGNCQSQGRIPAWIGYAWFLKIIPMIILNHFETIASSGGALRACLRAF